jgi:hypothetical protein
VLAKAPTSILSSQFICSLEKVGLTIEISRSGLNSAMLGQGFQLIDGNTLVGKVG